MVDVVASVWATVEYSSFVETPVTSIDHDTNGSNTYLSLQRFRSGFLWNVTLLEYLVFGG